MATLRTLLLSALVLLALAGGSSADEAKRDCRQGCEEAMRSCKAGCRPERDSGDLQQTDRYADCDADCHSTYSSCMDDCASE